MGWLGDFALKYRCENTAIGPAPCRMTATRVYCAYRKVCIREGRMSATTCS
jgi:hypothetical protein